MVKSVGNPDLNQLGQQIQNSPDTKTYQDELSYVKDQVELDIRRAYLETLQDNNRQRKRYAKNTFVLTCIWISVVLVIIGLCGFNIMKLSDTVLVTLISTTTANVFGFFFLVMKYLFKSEPENSQ
jgi:undecaprenyl pyrophosphate phosphatase UppP